jgi:hypothetical protein
LGAAKPIPAAAKAAIRHETKRPIVSKSLDYLVSLGIG